MVCIELKNMTFHSFHGTMEQEQIAGNDYRIDLKISLESCLATETDNIEDTINYADIFSLVKEEMAIPSQLIEHAAGRIVRIIKQNYPDISNITIRLAKINPPIQGEIEEAAIVISI